MKVITNVSVVHLAARLNKSYNAHFHSGEAFIWTRLYQLNRFVSHFLSAFGCPNLQQPSNATIKRRGFTTHVHCNVTARTYVLHCRKNTWTTDTSPDCLDGGFVLQRVVKGACEFTVCPYLSNMYQMASGCVSIVAFVASCRSVWIAIT